MQFFSLIWFLSCCSAKQKKTAFHFNSEYVYIFQEQLLENRKRLCLRSYAPTIVDFFMAWNRDLRIGSNKYDFDKHF